jgi:hypothetical protein
MTVKAIRLENFMAFADTGWIELRPITLLFGRNSSGKSAIIRALRLLRQNLDQPADAPYTLRLNSEYGVRLGGYIETVHGRDTDQVMRFHFRCSVPEAADAMRQEINQWRRQNNLSTIVASEEDSLTLTLEFGYDPHRDTQLLGIEISCLWQITVEPDSHTLLSSVWLDKEAREELGYDWQLGTDLPSWQALDWQRTSFDFLWNFLPQLIDSPINTLYNALDGLTQSIATFLQSIEYVGPIRPDPQRIYVLDDITRQRWRKQGWGSYVDLLEGNVLDYEKLTRIDEWLQALDLGDKILPLVRYPIDTIDKDVKISAIELKEQESELPINLKNTGYGASQVIPIIVHIVTARQRVNPLKSVYIVIEQPELHLHPQAQAQLADLLAETIYVLPYIEDIEGKKEKSQVNFLLETHSEHLLLRLQSRVAETFIAQNSGGTPLITSPAHEEAKRKRKSGVHLAQEDFGAYYVTRQSGVSLSTMLEISEDGDLINTPPSFDDFFADDLLETIAMARARNRFLRSGNNND